MGLIMGKTRKRPGGPKKPALPGLEKDVSEQKHQEWLAQWLDAKGIVWWHTPNEGKRNVRQGTKLKRGGMKAGVPDVIIITPAPNAPWARGVAIELKKPKGKKSAKGRLTPAQRNWLCWLERDGWSTCVAYGWKEAVEWLERLGY